MYLPLLYIMTSETSAHTATAKFRSRRAGEAAIGFWGGAHDGIDDLDLQYAEDILGRWQPDAGQPGNGIGLALQQWCIRSETPDKWHIGNWARSAVLG